MLQIYRKGYQSCENRGEWWIYQMIVESTYFLLIKNVDVRVDKQTRVPDNTNLVSTVMVLRVMVRPLWVESKKVVVVGHENWQWTNSNQTFNKAEFDMTCEHSLTLVTTHSSQCSLTSSAAHPVSLLTDILHFPLTTFSHWCPPNLGSTASNDTIFRSFGCPFWPIMPLPAEFYRIWSGTKFHENTQDHYSHMVPGWFDTVLAKNSTGEVLLVGSPHHV